MWAEEASVLSLGGSAQALMVLCVSPKGQMDTPPLSYRPCSGCSGPRIPRQNDLEPTFRGLAGSSPCARVLL